jgi:hypothetical protein
MENFRNVDKQTTVTMTKDNIISGDLFIPAYKKKIIIDAPIVVISGEFVLEKKLTFLNPIFDPVKKIEKLEKKIDKFNKFINESEKNSKQLLDIEKKKDVITNGQCIYKKIITEKDDFNFNIVINDKYKNFIIYKLVVIVNSTKGRCYYNIKFFYDPYSDNKNFSIISKEVAPDNYYNCSLMYTKDKLLKFKFSIDKISFDSVELSLYTVY